jgi:predicted nucleic acid binding AN1-type Zn finger protein
MKSRCAKQGCKNKLKLTDFECSCGFRFCVAHRHPEEHSCPKLEEKRKLHKQQLQETIQSAAFEKIQMI